jgi:hypothetical protein
MHGGADQSGGQPGNRNAFRHGRYTAEAIAYRRKVAALLRACRDQLGGMCNVLAEETCWPKKCDMKCDRMR